MDGDEIRMQIGNYETLRKLHGGDDTYTDIYEIIHKTTKQQMALKIIKGIDSELSKVIFEREIGALNKLRVCNRVVKMINYEIVKYKERLAGAIFLEYIDGKSLEKIAIENIGLKDKIKMINQLITAIKAAHENGIIHRDLSPNNIIVQDNYDIKLIDFGISKIKDMINSATVFQFATNKYAAPEVTYHSENATEQSDIYSLGAIIFYLFTAQEPPIPKKFFETIDSVGGIDIEIKDILKKMVAVDERQRYKDIFEVEDQLNSFFLKRGILDRRFVFTVNRGKVSYLRDSHLLSGNSLDDIITNKLALNFKNIYGKIKGLNTADERYIFMGQDINMECRYNSSSQMFEIDKFNKLYPQQREREKKNSLMIQGIVKFVDNTTRVQISHQNLELMNELKAYSEEKISDENIQKEYDKNYKVWHMLLDIMYDKRIEEAMRIEYLDFEMGKEYIIFHISEDIFYAMDELEDDITFIHETIKKGKTKQNEIGILKEKFIEDGKFYLRVLKTSKKATGLQKKGYICVDYRKDIGIIVKQRKEIQKFSNEEYVNTSNLKGILLGLETPGYFDNPKIIKFNNEQLDYAQKKAVEKALNCEDILLIQGPPGTGKTNVIMEIIQQIIDDNMRKGIYKKKILLVSQAHAAVDKMLEDLHEIIKGDVKVVRIGKEKVTDSIKQIYGIDSAKDRWLQTIQEKSQIWQRKFLTQLDISETDFNDYYRAINDREYDESRFGSVVEVVNQFQEKYKDRDIQEKVEAIIIQQRWIDRLASITDIQKYYIKNSTIISGTCTGFAGDESISNMSFDYVIIDEAAKSTLPELIMPIMKGRKIIMVGDHKQLPPVLDKNLILKNKKRFEEKGVDSNQLYISAFEKLFEVLPKENKHRLNTQYRMHPCIGTMISKIFYDNDIQNGVRACEREHTIATYKGKALVWIDTSKAKENEETVIKRDRDNKTYCNKLEGNKVIEQLRLLDNQIGGEKYSIGVITPYSAQKNLIIRKLQEVELKNIKGEVIVNSVDAFQGGQRDIIIYSTVRSNDRSGNIGFLKDVERLNVAFSRAKKLLIIIGNIDFLNDVTVKDNRFPDIIDYMRTNTEECDIIEC